MSMAMMAEKTNDRLYETYETLLLKRDQMYREAGSFQISYTKVFGDLIKAVFEEKIACIKLKKKITYYQAALNRGVHVDPEEMEQAIEKDMTMYYRELRQITERNENAKNARPANDIAVHRCKKLYKRIAKRIHPDINPWTAGKMELMDLWNRTVMAYRALNVKELEELEVLANHTMEKLGLDTIEIEIPNLEDKIEQVEKEINEILTTEPYIYEELLDDEDAVQEKKNELQKELEEYQAYQKELDDALRQMMVFDGVSALWGGQPE